MDRPLEDAAFLTRSPNRVALLRTLADGPRSRADLLAATGMSQVTLGRVLGDCASREWLTEDEDGTYRLTATGDLVVRSLADFLDALAAADRLGSLGQRLPTEEYDFGLERLASATIHRPEQADPTAVLRVAADQMRRTDHVRILTHAFAPPVVEILHERVLAGELTLESVFSPAVYETAAREPPMASQLRDLLAADGTEFYRAPNHVPHVLAILDDGLGIGIDDEAGYVHGVLDVADPVVVEWATETFARYRETATPVDVADFDALASG